MSLINQMLQDLEKRRASGGERGALPNQVRVLPHKENTVRSWWLAGIAGAVTLAAIFALRQDTNHPLQPAAPVLQSSTPSSVAPPVPVQAPLFAPLSRLSMELEKVPEARAPADNAARSPAEASVTVQSPERNPVALKVPKSPPPPAVATAAVIAARTVAPAQPAPVVATPAPARTTLPVAQTTTLASVAIKPAGSAPRMVDVSPDNKMQDALAKSQIDKRTQTLTAQQLAENEYRDAANFMSQGRLAEAQELFRRALQHNPGHVGARQGLFGLLLEAKKNGEAEQLLQEGIKLNPNQPGFALALSSLQYERGDTAGAIETMLRSAPAAQASPDYLARLAALLQRQSRHKEAVENYQAALRLAPGSGVWWMGLGISLQAMNRNGEAQDAFRRARATNSLNPELQAFVDQRLRQLP